MNIDLPLCPYCRSKCQMSTTFGFFKCDNVNCIKYQQNMVDALDKYIMIQEKWANDKGQIYCKTKRNKKKRYNKR